MKCICTEPDLLNLDPECPTRCLIRWACEETPDDVPPVR